MIVFPNAKINLGLNVVARRGDGYHDIRSVFYPVALTDVLEFVENEDSNQDVFTFSGIQIPGNTENNLCTKAIALLRKVKPIPPLKIHLRKVIPIGAGLGGGSSDGAWFLKALNEEFEIGLDTDSLQSLALELGSDCPFFIENKPVSVSGKGEVFSKISVDLTGYFVVLIFSDQHISTAHAYREIRLKSPDFLPSEVIDNFNISEWKTRLTNDFETFAFAQFPKLKKTKGMLYDHGALYASMTGSGSAVYGIFESKPYLNSEHISSEKMWLGEL